MWVIQTEFRDLMDEKANLPITIVEVFKLGVIQILSSLSKLRSFGLFPRDLVKGPQFK